MRQSGTSMSGEIRFALRQLRKHPGFALTAIFVLGLGVGASTAVFSVLYEALLKPLPYAHPDRIVAFHNSFPNSQLTLSGVSRPDYVEIGRHAEVFSETGVYFFNDLTMTGAGAARHVDPVNVSASLFRVLGVQPSMGRTISDLDDRYGAPKVAVLSDTFWRTAFGADRRALGRTIQLDGEAYTIIGVMPPAFQFPYSATQLWLPMALKPAVMTEYERARRWLQMIGRLTPGISTERAQAALLTIGHHLSEKLPSVYPEHLGWHFAIEPLARDRTQKIRAELWLAFGAVLCVFLIACSNVGGLLLIRASARSEELAIRAALGAPQYRIIRQILTETALLASAGCVLGMIFAGWAVRLCDRYGPVANGAAIELWTVLFAVAMAFMSTLAAGLAPAMASSRLQLERILKSGATRNATRAGSWRSMLVAGQIAVAVTLVCTAALLSRSFIALMQVSPGFVSQHVWSGSIALPGRDYEKGAGAVPFFEQLLQQVRSLPGVETASACTGPPFNESGAETLDVYFPGRPQPANQPKAQAAGAFPGYFETMNIPLRRGRTFTAQDRIGAERVALIDEAFARRYFGSEDPIGRFVGIGSASERPNRVVGVVGNVENTQIGESHKPQVYWPSAAEPSSAMYLVVRTRNDADITSAIRKQVAKLNRGVALFDVATMDERIAKSLKIRRFIALLLNAFATLGLVLAAVGLYASLAHAVEQRRREIGIRMALGAAWHDVLRMIALQGALLTSIGLVAGSAGAIIAAILIRKQLFGVRPSDAVTWAAVLVALTLATAIAVGLPALRAARMLPIEALREE